MKEISNFFNFLNKFVKFGKKSDGYIKELKLNDICEIDIFCEMDLEFLQNDIKMSKIHAKTLLKRINELKIKNDEMKNWMKNLLLSQYFDIFEENGIYHLDIFYEKCDTVDKIIHIIGIDKGKDANKLFKNSPKFLSENDNNGNDKENNDINHEEEGQGDFQNKTKLF